MAHILPSFALPIPVAQFADSPVPVRICRCFGADRQGFFSSFLSHMEAMRRNRKPMLLWVISFVVIPLFFFLLHLIYFQSSQRKPMCCNAEVGVTVSA